MAEHTIDWTGASGTKYKYWIYPLGQSFKAESGNYCIAKETSPGRWTPIYFGETSDLSERFDNHHKAACFRQNGATHIHAHLSGNKNDRLSEEADLIKHWNPTCNG